MAAAQGAGHPEKRRGPGDATGAARVSGV